MRVEIINGIEKYRINLEPLTQLCGVNIAVKQFIINSLEKYFSSAKYMAYEQKMQDNVYINGEVVGRKYFETLILRNRMDILQELKIAKTGRMREHLKRLLTKFSYQSEMQQIEATVGNIVKLLNGEIFGDCSKLQLVYHNTDLFDFVQECEFWSEDGKMLEELTNYELLDELLKFLDIRQMEEGNKMLFIIDNADHMLNLEEYEKVIQRLMVLGGKSDMWSVVTTSLPGYLVVNKAIFRGIVCVNDIVYNFPDYDEMKEYIEENYPMNKKFSEVEFMSIIRNGIHLVGKTNIGTDIRSKVFLKIINKTECLTIKAESHICSAEIAFLKAENVL